jgi:hypothetical protein
MSLSRRELTSPALQRVPGPVRLTGDVNGVDVQASDCQVSAQYDAASRNNIGFCESLQGLSEILQTPVIHPQDGDAVACIRLVEGGKEVVVTCHEHAAGGSAESRLEGLPSTNS